MSTKASKKALQIFRLDAQSMVAAGLVPPPDATPGLKWNQIFPLGKRFRADFPDGVIDFTPKFIATVVANWAKAGRPALPVDYFHRGASEADGLSTDEKVAAGWIEEITQAADGTLWGGFKWTAKAKQHIDADELRYLSPTFSCDGWDTTTGREQGPTLYGAGLLNDPFLQDLPRVAASNQPPAAQKEKRPMEFMTKLRTALGLPETATEEECLSCVGTKMAAPPMPPPPAPAPLPVGMSAAEVASQVKLATAPLATKLATLEEENLKLKSERLEAEVVALEKEFEDRFVPANRGNIRVMASKMGVPDARTILAAMPSAAPDLKERGIPGNPNQDANKVALSYVNELAAFAKEKGLTIAAARRPFELTRKKN